MAVRQGELIRLRCEHIDLNCRTAHLPDTKNGESRTVPLSTTAVRVLRALPRSLHEQTFPGVTTEAIKRAYIRAVRRAGIENLRFHIVFRQHQPGGKYPTIPLFAFRVRRWDMLTKNHEQQAFNTGR